MIFRHLSLKYCALVAIFISQINAYNFSKCAEFYLNTSQAFTLEAFGTNISANHRVDSRAKKIRAIHIGNGKYLAFIGYDIDNAINQNMLFYDRFTGLALFGGKKIMPKYDLIAISQSAKNLPLVAITEDSLTQGRILQSQKSLKNKAIFSHQIPPNAVISDICYQSYGLSLGGNRFIDKAYIARFLQDISQDGTRVYSDLGLEVAMQDGTLIIKSINPFMRFTMLDSDANRANLGANQSTDSLLVGDEIVAINGVAVKNEDTFFDIASMLPLGKKAIIRIKRGGKEFALLPMKRERGFDESGTLMDFFGVVVDDNLRVIRAPIGSIFKKWDKILRLNQIIVENKAELDSAILRVLQQKSDFSFLLTRNDFEFFITFKNEDK